MVASKTIKPYDTLKAPYQRVLESKCVSQSVKQNLQHQFQQFDPFKSGCNTLIANYIPVQNYLAMVKTIDKFGWYT